MQTLFLLVALSMATGFYPTGHVHSADVRISLSEGPSSEDSYGFDGDLDPFLGEASAPTDNAAFEDYLVYEHYEGNWSDAEKTANNTDDDSMCWAAAASNVLEWTGWGFVNAPEGDLTNCDEMFAHYQAHWVNKGAPPNAGWCWWFNGTGDDLAIYDNVDVDGGGDFWTPPYNYFNFAHYYRSPYTQSLQKIDEYLSSGYGVALAIKDAAHAITCWGFRYDPSVNKTTNPQDYYKGIWVTNSDDDKNFTGPAQEAPNRLRYYNVSYNSTKNKWIFVDGWPGRDITVVYGLEHFNAAPIAEANGPYVGFEGAAIIFDGSGSIDPEGKPLQYRWDFNNDGEWDTDWIDSSPTVSHVYPDDYNGLAVLQVSDNRTSITDVANVTISNVAPTVAAGPDQTVYSNDTVSFSGSFTDPGSDTVTTIEWDFGDGSAKLYGTLTPTHVYLVAQVYTVNLTVTDDDGGVGWDTLTILVEPIPVPIDIKPGSDPNSINPRSNGLVPVAILNDASWTPYYINPALVDPSSVVFGPNEASPVKWFYEDVDLDGDIDLILFFNIQQTGITDGDTSAILTANLTDGEQITGFDYIWTTPRKKK